MSPTVETTIHAGRTTTCVGGETTCVGGETTCVGGETTCVGGETTCVGGQTICVGGEMTCVSGETTCVSGETACVGGETTYVGGETTCVGGETTCVGGETTCVGGETTRAACNILCSPWESGDLAGMSVASELNLGKMFVAEGEGNGFCPPVTDSHSAPPLVQARDLVRKYTNGVAALDGVSLEIAKGEFVSITGPSGCGKSTLLHLLAGLDTPTRGELSVGGLPLHRAGDRELTNYRRHTVGVVFQFFHLLPTMSVLENVMLPRLLHGDPVGKVQPDARALLDLVGLSERENHFPHQLSGGQMQRTAIARALIHEPPLLLADEPTGNLDSGSSAQVLDLIQKIASQGRTTLVVVTHSLEVAQLAQRQVRLRDGQIQLTP